MTHRTLVDELWNDSRIFLKEGKLAFAENEARKFKEDCHRLAGAAKSAVVYYAPGGIQCGAGLSLHAIRSAGRPHPLLQGRPDVRARGVSSEGHRDLRR